MNITADSWDNQEKFWFTDITDFQLLLNVFVRPCCVFQAAAVGIIPAAAYCCVN